MHVFINKYWFTVNITCDILKNMYENIELLIKKKTELQARLERPEVYSNAQEYNRLEKELREIAPLTDAYAEFKACDDDIAAAFELEDNELLRESRERKAELEHEIKLLLLPKDPNDERNTIVEIRAGVGGEESALFAADLFRMYSMYAETKGWKVEIVSSTETELGGIKEIVFLLEGDKVFSRMKYEAGGHRVQRVPVTESGGRIHTSAATVAILPEIDEVDFKLDMSDVRIDVFRSSGAGGQKVNKTSSAIRVTYLPTGLVVECQDERSQYKNKDRALQILRSRLYEAEHAKQDASVAAERKNQVGSGDRSDRVRTYNFPQNRVTDHRLTGEGKNYNLAMIIDGALDELIDALIAQDQAEKLNNHEN